MKCDGTEHELNIESGENTYRKFEFDLIQKCRANDFVSLKIHNMVHRRKPEPPFADFLASTTPA